MDVPQRSHIFINYIEALRQDKQYAKAAQVGEDLLQEFKKSKGIASQDFASLYLNVGIIYTESGNPQKGYEFFKNCVAKDQKNEGCWYRLVELLIRAQNYIEAEKEGRSAIQHLPKSCLVHYYLGVAMHFQKKVDDAMTLYFHAEQLDPTNLAVKSNIAAALQGLGRVEEAAQAYRTLIPLLPNDAGLLNNYGSLLGIQGKREEEVYWLMKALEIDPHMEQAIMNMAGYYQDEGLLDDAKMYLQRFSSLPDVNKDMLQLRLSTMLSPISVSWKQMVEERRNMAKHLLSIVSHCESATSNVTKSELDSAYDRIHFYLSYHGMNDRPIQELVTKAYHCYVADIGHVMPNLDKSMIQMLLQHEKRSNRELLSASASSSSTTMKTQSKGIIRIMGIGSQQQQQQSQGVPATIATSKKRVGFCSKFFGVFEPHGMLLDGAMKYLPRDQFVVVCLAVARTDGKPLASTVKESCDEVHDISLVFQHAVEFIAKLNLDALVFADLVSEPMNHFLSQVRLAPIQVLLFSLLQLFINNSLSFTFSLSVGILGESNYVGYQYD